ncbi:hypothetical protein [Niabella drilacis]|uniref:Membrane or secreted protein n=1 Tax=Niabella drilacis (strain DSM 25811 / CCM 8410 / CCUG 62505 / LMG 26954 / E90) TaxID=1285928 RepID=A0A1G7A281_NIADE|nr:hypothetical protein [Niabella drilacis]SDE08909.1 hypothetical protein SAMN04487894_12062 [Niabella drilacis]
MKLKYQLPLWSMFCLILFAGFTGLDTKTPVTGSWMHTRGNETWILMAADNYCMIAHYDATGKRFFKTFGGFQRIEKGKLQLNYRFHSDDKSKTGTRDVFTWNVKGGKAQSDLSGETGEWVKVGEANNRMTGIWRITKRREGNDLKDIKLAPRRTLKFLTNDRFQWAAINVETGEFSGTGGGTYTFKDGVYTETIGFFSRDSSRVGMKLEFNDRLDGPDWVHTGLSSKGDPIYEVWSKTAESER